MAEGKILENLWEAWRLFRLWLYLKWILLFRRLPRDAYQWITIEPEGIRIQSFRPDNSRSQWDGEAYFEFIGMRARFCITMGSSKPSEAEFDFLRTLLRRKQSFRHALAVEMFKHYQEYVFNHMDFRVRKEGKETYIPAPAVATPSALDNTVYSSSIYFSDDDAGQSQFDIHVKCDLDVVLQSFTLRVKDWRVVRVE
ncbi:MAG TPA: hypothetical protein VFV87_21000 [Pirellulaceae bacterium]|nr:hypothetical protein [Pirellulaceae bacterium]